MNGAVIVETRNVNIESVIDRHLKYLPGWECTVFHYDNFDIDNLKIDYPVKFVKLKINIKCRKDYNVLMTSKEFWESIPYDTVLVFQSDSGILRKGIDKFLIWDWVGAPWTFQSWGGNGGLSIRTKKVMLDIIKKCTYTNINEDVWFCNIMLKNKIGILAPRHICRQFCIESIYELGTFAYHAIEIYFSNPLCQKIYSQYQ